MGGISLRISSSIMESLNPIYTHNHSYSQSSFNSQDTCFNSQLSTPPLTSDLIDPPHDLVTGDSGDYFHYKRPTLSVDVTPAEVLEKGSFISPVEDDDCNSINSHLQSYDSNLFIPNFTPFNFLLVDDNVINLKILAKFLNKLYPNSQCVQIQDSTKVMKTLEKQAFDLVFLDIEMPILTGTDLASLIRLNHLNDGLGLIAVTTRHYIEDLKLYSKVGIDFTFAKPLNYSHNYMMSCIDQVINCRKNY